jgi:hypothetical protein
LHFKAVEYGREEFWRAAKWDVKINFGGQPSFASPKLPSFNFTTLHTKTEMDNDLDEFEKALVEEKKARERTEKHSSREKDSRKHRHHHKSTHKSHGDHDRGRDRLYKRSRHLQDDEEGGLRRTHKHAKTSDPHEDLPIPDDEVPTSKPPQATRDSWMTTPSALEFDYTQKGARNITKNPPSKPDYDLKIHKNELNQHLQDLVHGTKLEEIADEPAQHEVSYTFGDSGAQWVSAIFWLVILASVSSWIAI